MNCLLCKKETNRSICLKCVQEIEATKYEHEQEKDMLQDFMEEIEA